MAVAHKAAPNGAFAPPRRVTVQLEAEPGSLVASLPLPVELVEWLVLLFVFGG